MTTMTLLGLSAVFGVAALARARAVRARKAPIAGRRRGGVPR